MANPGCAGHECTLKACTDNFYTARKQAFARSSEMCQFCGSEQAVNAHHWEPEDYTPNCELTASHFTALCKTCHLTANCFRRLISKLDFSHKQLEDKLREAGADQKFKDVTQDELQGQLQVILRWVEVGEVTIAGQQAITQISQAQENVSEEIRVLRTDLDALISQRGSRTRWFVFLIVAAIAVAALYLWSIYDIPAFLIRLYQLYAP
ncbi:MAG: hypothetical protein OXK78_04305 [Caldilineaceae bacterium]|nr:hypothetical protein [Caldilineaceae bacterium]